MKYLTFGILTICMTVIASAQELHLRPYFGLSYYKGDLSPRSNPLSFSTGHPAYGIQFGGQISRSFTVSGRFMKGKITGDDAKSRDESRRRRNLNFKSNVYELGLVAEYSVNKIWRKLDDYGVYLYLSGGVNAFHFNPKTEFRGELVALHPLMTEGQGSFAFPDQERYHLSQINFPFGWGVSFEVAGNLHFGLEITTRLTFTDYLDDVSTIYINYQELVEEFGELTALLANRTGEFLGTEPVLVSTGTLRGESSDNDWYFFTGVFLSYVFGE